MQTSAMTIFLVRRAFCATRKARRASHMLSHKKSGTDPVIYPGFPLPRTFSLDFCLTRNLAWVPQ
uniref:Uncharacterized protein n=1 Tax=Arundo donax TaxID=35708 RepID=A0A0A9BFE2_ARUDO